jgi:hypothetical protein
LGGVNLIHSVRMTMVSNDKQTDEPLEPLLLGAGKLLVLLQHLEHVVRLSCTFLQIKGIKITVDDILSDEPKKGFNTLGNLLKTIMEPMGFKPSFQTRLDAFIEDRNTFIHDYWVKNGVFSVEESIDQATFRKIALFEKALYDETIFMTRVFLGLNYSIGTLLASREGKIEEFETDLEFEKMKENAPIFLSVIEGVGNGESRTA